MPYKLLVPFVDEVFDQNGTLVNENIAKNFEKFANEFIWFAEAIVSQKAKQKAKVLL
jgi:hypothetical protein